MSYENAGKIAGEALEYGKGLVREGEKLRIIAEKIEEKIKSLNGEIAFPVQISINNIAAHYCPELNDELEIKNGDLVKLDIGVHVDGKIGDCACSININNNYSELIKASKEALNAAIEKMRPGIELREIGRSIEEVIKSYGFNPIKNLSGHEIKEYELHSGLIIPNYDNNDKTKLEEGQIFAVEPFATKGEGFVKDGKLSGVYHLVIPKNVRSGREILEYIIKNYRTLPFARRWLLKDFSEFKVNFGLRMLERENIIQQYHQLIDRSNGIVSQAEHTIKVDDKPIVLTKV